MPYRYLCVTVVFHVWRRFGYDILLPFFAVALRRECWLGLRAYPRPQATTPYYFHTACRIEFPRLMAPDRSQNVSPRNWLMKWIHCDVGKSRALIGRKWWHTEAIATLVGRCCGWHAHHTASICRAFVSRTAVIRPGRLREIRLCFAISIYKTNCADTTEPQSCMLQYASSITEEVKFFSNMCILLSIDG